MIRFSFQNVLTNSTSIMVSSEMPKGRGEDSIIAQMSTKWETSNVFTKQHYIRYVFLESTVSCLGLFGLDIDIDSTLTIKLFRNSVIIKEINIDGNPVIYGYGEGPYGLFGYGGYDTYGREWARKSRVIWFEDVVADTIEINSNSKIGRAHV